MQIYKKDKIRAKIKLTPSEKVAVDKLEAENLARIDELEKDLFQRTHVNQ